MKHVPIVIFLVLLASLPLLAQTEHTIDVTDQQFGAVPNDQNDDFNAVVAACKAMQSNDTLFFPPGVYDFHMQQWGFPVQNAIYLKQLSNVTVEGSGAVFCYHGFIPNYNVNGGKWGSLLHVYECNNVTVQNFSVIYGDRSHVTRGTVTSVTTLTSPACTQVNLRITNPAHFLWIQQNLVVKDFNTFNAQGQHLGVLATPTGVGWNAPDVGQGRQDILLTFSGTALATRITSGDIGILVHHDYSMDPVQASFSIGVYFKNITINSSPGMGVRVHACEDVTLDNVKVQLGTNAFDMISASRDGVHVTSCSGVVSMQSCVVSDQNDDAANIYQHTHEVTAVYTSLRQVNVRAHNNCDSRGVNLGANERVLFYAPDWSELWASAELQSGWTLPQIQNWQQQGHWFEVHYNDWKPVYQLILKNEQTHGSMSTLNFYNVVDPTIGIRVILDSHRPDVVSLTNSAFLSSRGHGLVAGAAKVVSVVYSNFQDITEGAVLGGGHFGDKAPPSQNISIEQCTVDYCNYLYDLTYGNYGYDDNAPINVRALAESDIFNSYKRSPASAIENVSIVGNVITNTRGNGWAVASATNVNVSGNTVDGFAWNAVTFPPPRPQIQNYGASFENCNDITESNNNFTNGQYGPPWILWLNCVP